MTEKVVDRFYQAFQRKDGEAMAACYGPETRFSDPVFPALKGAQAADMWRMLCGRSTDLAIEYRSLGQEGDWFVVQWDATYTFTQTGRKVKNHVTSRLRLQGDRIVEQRDHFSFWKWASQALGISGMVLGWSPWLQGAVQKKAARSLESFSRKNR